MTDLQLGAAPVGADEQLRIDVRPLTDVKPIAGRTWVELTVHYRDHQATLVGLAPTGGEARP